MTRPRLEQLEDRVAAATFDTVTNVDIKINPTYFFNAIETITATLTQAGTNTPVTSGNVVFNLNNRTATAPLNDAGAASFTTTLPLLAVATNQTVQAFYEGAATGSDTFNSSVFFSPVYLNQWNAFLLSFISFAGPPPAQSTLPINSYGSYNGENDMFLYNVPGSPVGETFILVHYVDPGVIQSIRLS